MNFGNPLLARDEVLRDRSAAALTVNGVMNKTGILFAVLLVAFGYTWHLYNTGAQTLTIATVAAIAGFVLALIIIFAKKATPFLIIPYAACQGLFLGGISAYYEAAFPGIVMQAALLTLACFFGILIAYKMNIIRYSPGLAKFLMVAIFGIVIAYLVSFIGSFFGMPLKFLHDSSPLSIGISIFIVIIATLSFVIDFEAINQAAQQSIDKKQEWYFAFSLMVSLVWLYLEVLRLLGKLRGKE